MKLFAGLILAGALASSFAQTIKSGNRTVQVPGESQAETLRWLEARKQTQERAAKDSTVFRDFRFVDGLPESGITFRHAAVDEAGKRFKPNHYDHGTAVAAADIDKDGWTDLYFVNQREGNELWRNLGKGRFENITAAAGVALADTINVGASFGDLDNDGLPDLVVTTVKMGNHLFRNEGRGHFRDITETSGIQGLQHSSGAVLFDFNRDGWLDIFVCNVGVYTTAAKANDGSYHALDDAFTGFLKPDRLETSVLYQNLGGFKFRNVNKELRFEHREWSGDATFCDLAGNGYPGLYVLSMSGENRYYANERGKAFVNKTRGLFGPTPWGAMGVKFFDYNRDGKTDLLVTDMHSDMNTVQLQLSRTNRSEQFERLKSEAWCSAEWVRNQWPGSSSNFLFGNALFRNDGDRFKEVSQEMGVETYWPWGMSVGDINADGYDDVFVTAGMGYPLRYGINSLLLNLGGQRFMSSEFLLGVEPRPRNTVLIDYFTVDCDGEDKGHPFCQGKGGKVTVRASTSSRSSLFCDLDGDGDLDLVVNNMNDAPLVLLNNLSSRKKVNYLTVRLHGSKSNRDGLGAMVKVATPKSVLTQYNDGKSGYLAQSSLPLYFGLGDNDQISRVEVLWPSGATQSIENVSPNHLLQIYEPQ